MSTLSRMRLSKASVGDEEMAELEKVMRQTVNFGLGIHVQELESDIGKFIGGERDVVCVNTGTSALHISLAALDFPKGSEVIVPSLTFVASYQAIYACGLVPVSCDVTWPDGHLDPVDVAKRVTTKTVAIMPVAYSGTDFNRKAIYEISTKHKLRVIEDDAHAFGSLTANGNRFGSEGDVICFSFDGIKNITCGEGGAVVTKDKNLAHRIRVMRGLGIEQDVVLRYQGTRAWNYDIQGIGFRYHMSNINAAIGVAQLRKFPKLHAARASLVKSYLKCLAENEDLGVIGTQPDAKDTDCLHILPMLLPRGVARESVREKMLALGIESGFHYAPNHLHTLFKSSHSLPVVEEMAPRLWTPPLHPELPTDAPQRVFTALRTVLNELK